MLEGFEQFVGRKIKEEYKDTFHSRWKGGLETIVRPDFIGPNTSINMYVYTDDNYVINDIDGNKCIRGRSPNAIFDRSYSVRESKFTKRELAWLKKYIKNISTINDDIL